MEQRRNRTGRRIFVLAATATLVVLLVYGGISWVFSSKLVAAQFPSQPEVVFADFNLPQPENLEVANGDTRISGWFFENPQDADCAVILLHGFSGNRATVLIASPLFWDRGCDVLAYDLRGHGQSSEGPLSYGVHDKHDEIEVVDWLKEHTGLSDSQIGLVGWSYGAATSLQAAALRPELAFVIADASYSSVQDIASVQAGQPFGDWAKVFVPGALFFSGWRADFDTIDASPENAVENLTTPVLLVHSTTDEFTPYSHSETIFARSNQQHTILELTDWGAPHAQSYGTDPVAYKRFMDAFLDSFAPNFGSSAA